MIGVGSKSDKKWGIVTTITDAFWWHGGGSEIRRSRQKVHSLWDGSLEDPQLTG